MAISLKHLFQSAKADGPDNTIVQPSDWNDEHVLTQGSGKLLGRTSAGTGATEEIAPGTGITLSAGTLSADVTSVAGRTGAVTLSTADISGLTTGYVQKTSATGSAYLPAGTTGEREGSPSAGYIRYNTTTGKFEGYGSSWGNIGGGAAIGDTPPANPGAGDLWWNSADGRMYVYYTDANSSQWVDLSAGGAGQYLPLTGGDVTGNVTVTGNVGIGTTAPSTLLHVSGSAASGKDPTLTLANTTASTGRTYQIISGDGGPFRIQDVTANQERMRIDASGRVTMPYQPAFHATGPYTGGLWSVSASAGTGYVIIYTGTLVNRGGHYNTSNGRFTAPVAGCYYFFASITAAGVYSGPQLFLRVNGGGLTGNVIAYTNTGYCTAAGSWIVQLNAGDFVDCYWQANNMATAIDLSRAHFNGHLIG